jgi:hypothetical protein
MPDARYVPYDDSVEVRQPDEDQLVEKITASLGRISQRAFEKHRHAKRDAHAKSHGVLKGVLSVYDGLPEPLAQGLFAAPRTYPVVVRLSTAPGDIEDDAIPAPRGMAIKIFGVDGPKALPAHEHETTQDFLLVNLPTIPFGDVAAYWRTQQILERLADQPDFLKRITAELAGNLGRVLRFVGMPNQTLEGLGPPNTHLLGETYYSMAALRFGDYIAKLGVAPLSASVRRLTGQAIHAGGNPSVLRDLVVDFFRSSSAEYEVRAQLCTDLTRMPVEDASVEWPERESPYRPVGKITLPPQEAYSPARRVYADDALSFNSWHTLAAHRPLGSLARARIRVYEASASFRRRMNAQPRREPRDIAEVPD